MEPQAPTMDKGLAHRLASATASIDGVRGAVVASLDGEALGSAGNADAARHAALASFVAFRAEALPVDGDLRGMGRQLAGSRFDHVAIAGATGDSLILGLGHAYLYLALASGRAATILPALSPVLRRFALLPNPAPRSQFA